MKIDEAFPSNYLKASDLGGKRVVVTIASVSMEKLGEDNKAIVYFTGKDKGLVLNIVNKNTIVDITGSDETNDWRGKKITLYSARVEYKGKMTDGIRIDVPPPSGTAAAPAKKAAPPVEAEPPEEDFSDSDIPF